MDVELFDFHLPEELIAQKPLSDRTASKLLVLNKETEEVNHQSFTDFLTYLKAGDCLVLNDTRVLPARLFGEKADTGAKLEVLLLKEKETDVWETLVKRAKKVNVGTEIVFGDGSLTATCIEKKDMGGCLLKFNYEGIFLERLEALGEMPLPPYIKEQLSDKERYQTVYAKEEGSAAAPTAGLHFTEELLQKIKAKGVSVVTVTLHVGLGTFRPVNVEQVTDHKMHAEYYELSEQTAQTLNDTRQNGGNIIAVGTTSARTLETVASQNDGTFKPSTGWTDIFIYPPYEFQGIDGLLTNFHLPKSTLVMLVSAFASKSSIIRAYEEAIAHNYRFFSFGDAMLIIS